MPKHWKKVSASLMLAAVLVGAGALVCMVGPALAHVVRPQPPLSVETPSAVNLGTGLAVGQTLNANQYLQSGNGQYELDMYPGGLGALWAKLPGTQPCVMWTFPPTSSNLTADKPTWLPMATPKRNSYLIMQTDGNFVLYPSGQAALWASGTAGHGGATLTLQDDGNLVIYQNGAALWSTSTNSLRGPALCANNVLKPGQALLQSASMNNPTVTSQSTGKHGAWKLLVTTDGYLQILDGDKTKTTLNKGPAGSYLIMQYDGNLVFYAPGGTPLWASNTDGTPNAIAMISNWGDLFVVNSSTMMIVYSTNSFYIGWNVGQAAIRSMVPGYVPG